MADKKQVAKRKQQRLILILAASAAVVGLLLCTIFAVTVGSWLGNRFGGDATVATEPERLTWHAESAVLTIATSPLMAPVLEGVATTFNEQARETADGETMQVQVVTLEPAKMIAAALERPDFQAISPDSTLWLEQLEADWQAQSEQSNRGTEDATSVVPVGQQRTSGQIRYAVSPVVIVAWENVARELGWPAAPVGWQTIQQKATADPEFKWNHASTNTASGLLATLAEFYAGAGLTRGLTAEAATRQETLDYVAAVESTVRFYGEGEAAILQRLATEGNAFLDAFVAQERVVIEWNRQQPAERLVAIYPAEGALWTDHPLALLELGTPHDELAVTDNQRLTYRAFTDYLLSADAQQTFLNAGYRPADLQIDLSGAGSPFANTDAVDWQQPQTTLQMPSPTVIEVVRNSWYYTKRPTNVYLVVDTSGSMAEGNKLPRTQEALRAFLAQIKGERDQVGLVEFADGIKRFTPLRPLDDQTRADLNAQIDQMNATGGTALLDATYDVTNDLLARGDAAAINAIVVMTDGQENESSRSLAAIEQLLATESQTQFVIFTVAFGQDADEGLLRRLAEIGEGQLRHADETEIEELYRIISTYF